MKVKAFVTLRALPWLAVVSLCPPFLAPVFAQEPQVRVAIVQEALSVRVTILGPCRALDPESGKVLSEWPHLRWKEVRASNPGLEIGGMEFASRSLVLEGVNDAEVRIDSRPYRGSLILYRTPSGKVTVINRLGLEEYLVGALSSEVSPRWPLEVLKAHAVASRTMVAHRIWIRRGQPFDVTADVSTHLYHGRSAERGRTRQAVAETRGLVLAHAGELFSATFHANCGGHTEDASELWETKREIPPLKGQPDPYCRGLRHYRWQTKMSSGELTKMLGAEARSMGRLRACEILERNRSGRVRSLRLVGEEGAVRLTGRRFREQLGADRLRSLNFTVSVEGDEVRFSGQGWGHGVGFCQWGAYGMARKGKKMDEILSFYFPEARVRALKGLPGHN